LREDVSEDGFFLFSDGSLVAEMRWRRCPDFLQYVAEVRVAVEDENCRFRVFPAQVGQ
jgi:hypothetical protein